MVGDDILPADPAGDADDIRADTVGLLAASQMGRRMGEVAHEVSDGTFLRGDALLRRFLFACILLIINHISFIKLLA